MEILFIRHPNAERKHDDIENQVHRLTKEGGSILQELVPQLREKLNPVEGKRFVLWSSPTLSTLETAYIVAYHFEIRMTSVHEFIYKGDYESFSQELQTVSDETTVIIVGHQPYLSDWLYGMTGTDEQVKRENIINLKVVNKAPLKAELQWMISS